jgi:hypothetical protein
LIPLGGHIFPGFTANRRLQGDGRPQEEQIPL